MIHTSLDGFKLQPNSAMCFGCGLENHSGLQMRFVDNGTDELRSEISVPEHFQSYPGVVHGGIITSILDEATGRVPLIGDPDHFMMTVKLEVKFRQPVPVETTLTVIARIVKQRGRLMTTRSEVRLPDGTLAAEAEVLLADLPAEVAIEANLAELAWRIWPQE